MESAESILVGVGASAEEDSGDIPEERSVERRP